MKNTKQMKSLNTKRKILQTRESPNWKKPLDNINTKRKSFPTDDANMLWLIFRSTHCQWIRVLQCLQNERTSYKGIAYISTPMP